jgi:hypothetical protein
MDPKETRCDDVTQGNNWDLVNTIKIELYWDVAYPEDGGSRFHLNAVTNQTTWRLIK